jgi:Disulphide bond corrector protein DsbC
LCLPLLCLAQQNKLVVSPPEPIVVKRGGSAVETLRIGVLDGFHVNSNKPKDEYLIPLKLTWTGGPLEAKSITYPKPEQVKVGADLLDVFTGKFEIRTEFKSADTAARGNATMTGKLRYQACNGEMCFRPATADVTVPVTIE